MVARALIAQKLVGPSGSDAEALPLEDLPLEDLPLEDFHVLRALLVAAGALDEPESTVLCSNCGEQIQGRPSTLLELGPYLDGELGDEVLDEAFPFDEPMEIPALRLGQREVTQMKLRPSTLGEARSLFDALEAEGPLRFTAEVVRALGIERLGDEADEERIAEALQGASDEVLDAVADAFDSAAYAPRMSAAVRCEGCGARCSLPAPADREFPEIAAPSAPDFNAPIEGFPSFERFSAMVEQEAELAFSKLRLRNIGLDVEGGVAACDDGGVPLLGSYDPPSGEGNGVLARGPEVRLYYRTFKAMFVDEGPYDVGAEIAETLEHELEHHLAFLRGYDPQDELERAEIVHEERRLVGEAESLRRASREARAGLADFLYRTWPLWLVLLLGTLLASRAAP